MVSEAASRSSGWLRRGQELLVRGTALFLGLYFLCSWLLDVVSLARYDATIWWIDLRVFPPSIAVVCLAVFTGALLHRAVWPCAGPCVMRLRSGILWLMVGVLVFNTLAALWLSASVIDLGNPVPLTAVVALVVVWMIRRPTAIEARSMTARLRRLFGITFAAGGFALLAALAQMFWFGETDYRRPADAIVVYGCKAYPDGRPSQALADRVHTACALYHQGLAPYIVMSGGPVQGSDGLVEPQAMADYAVSLGVPREAIVFDANGLDTLSTAANLRGVLAEVVPSQTLRILAVSHDYHLPRVKLSLEREGITTYTVPCEIRRGLPSKPYLMARETAAWWYYFFQPMIADY